MNRFVGGLFQPIFTRLARPSERPRRVASLGLRVLRRAAPLFGDPNVVFELDGTPIELPLSHDLPAIRARLPEYSSVIGRFAALLHEVEPDAAVVDVGANVGDTVAIVRHYAPLAVLCIEASELYFPLLQQNVGSLPDVFLEQGFVAGDETPNVTLRHERGSARAVPGEPTASVNGLSDFIAAHPAIASKVRLVKTDTDGMDGRILWGSREWLREHGPVLFFEYDPSLWALQGDDARLAFGRLRELGYDGLMFYDNEGAFLLATNCSQDELLDDLCHWVAEPSRRRYFDVFAFTRRDRALFVEFLSRERARLRRLPPT
jgi:FkbM family methyltransferase